MSTLFALTPGTTAPPGTGKRASDWQAFELPGDLSRDAREVLWLSADAGAPVRRARCGAPMGHARVVRGGMGSASWCIVSLECTTMLNGLPLAAGFAALTHRDEIRLGCGARFVYSTERRALVQAFRDKREVVHCARCKQSIAAGAPAVACPSCGIWHHQSAELPCWQYSAASACGCRYPTDLDGLLFWPEAP